MIGSDDIPVVKIGGVDYGPLGLDLVRALNTNDSGPRVVGDATVGLLAAANAGYNFPAESHVETYTVNGAQTRIMRRLFGGFVSLDDTDRIGMSSAPGVKKTWDLRCQAYNVALDRLVLPKVTDTNDYDDRAPEGTFVEQLEWAVYKAQHPPGRPTFLGYPLIGIDYTSGVAINPGPTLEESEQFGGRSLGYMIQQICAATMAADPGLYLRFFVGLLPTPPGGSLIAEGFGGPVLHIYDAKELANPENYYTDDKTLAGTTVLSSGGYKYQQMRRVPRSRDGASLVQWRQGQYGGLVLDPTLDTSNSVATYSNPLASDGTWKAEPLDLSGSADETAAQAKLDQNLASTQNPMESFDIESLAWTRPGGIAGLHVDIYGLDPTPTLDPADRAWYVVSSAGTSWAPGAPVWSVMRLGSRLLRPGETPENDATYAPIEKDKVKPQPPSGVSITRNVYNPSTGYSEVTATATQSTSGDVGRYEFSFTETAVEETYLVAAAPVVGATTVSATRNIAPGDAFEVFAVALDANNNRSDPSSTVGSSSAPAITEALYNGKFEYPSRSAPTKPDGWVVSGPGTVFLAHIGNSNGPYEGKYAIYTAPPGGAPTTLTSTKFVMGGGADYELSVAVRIESFPTSAPNGATIKIRFYDVNLAHISGQDQTVADTSLVNYWQIKALSGVAPSTAVAADIVLQNDGTYQIDFDDVTVLKTASSVRGGGLRREQAVQLAQFVPTSGKTLTVLRSITLTAPSDGLVLTVPATGTVALLGTANVFTAAQLSLSPATGAATLSVGSTNSTATMVLSGAAGQTRELAFRTGSINRWRWLASATAEGGSNAGSDFILAAVADGGTSIGNALLITRATLAMTFGGDVTMTDGKNLITGATTGMKIGTATSQKLGFYGATPVVRPGAYTQTYATADKTLAAYTSDTESTVYTGIASGVAGTPYAQLTDVNALRTAYENLRAFVEDLAGVVNAHTDDFQALGLVG